MTVQEVFNTTMALLDEISTTSGLPSPTDTADYKHRSVFMINLLKGELYAFSDSYQSGESGKRNIPKNVTSFLDVIPLDDYICGTVLPYGLASHLLLDENPNAASFYQQRYEEMLRKISTGVSTGSEPIENVYGSFEYNDDARW